MSQVALPEVAQKRILERNTMVQQAQAGLQQAQAQLNADIELIRTLQDAGEDAKLEQLPDGTLVWSLDGEEQ